MNIFERAARSKLRFATASLGYIAVEDLFDLPLKAKRTGQADLDSVARGIARELREIGEESFVDDDKPNAKKVTLELQLELVKYVIEDKKSAEQSAAKAAETRALKAKLTDALAAKQDAALAAMSEEDLKAKLAALGA